MDDLRVISGIIFVIKSGLQWRDAPKEYGPHKPLYNRFVRWSWMGVFNKIFSELAAQADKPDGLKRTAPPVPRRIGLTKGGINSKLHAVHDQDGKLLILLLSEGHQ